MIALAGGRRTPTCYLHRAQKLEYLKTAKRLTPRQTKWALFFSQFHFTINYLPGSKNTKADTLSWVYPSLPTTDHVESILHESCFIEAITWDINQEITQANRNVPSIALLPSFQDLSVETMWAHISIVTDHTQVWGNHPFTPNEILVGFYDHRYSEIHLFLLRLC